MEKTTKQATKTKRSRSRSMWSLVAVAIWSLSMLVLGQNIPLWRSDRETNSDSRSQNSLESAPQPSQFADKKWHTTEMLSPLPTKLKIGASSMVKKQATYATSKVNLTLFVNDKAKKIRLPPLNELIGDEKMDIKSDVSFMMDYAILGHAKCATSFLSSWIRQHPKVLAFDKEVCDLYSRKPASLVKKLHEGFPSGDYLRGFKCPGHFSRKSLNLFPQFFPNTRLIVGVRHPVKWFESYYNFRTRHGTILPNATQLIGKCTHESIGICTEHSKFHVHLSKLGKTNISDAHERSLLQLDDKYNKEIPRIENPLFLYHADQLYDSDQQRFAGWKRDFEDFMVLEEPLPNIVSKPESSRREKAIDICDPQYDKLRAELIKAGSRASTWIRHYFLDSPSVFYSDRVYLESLLREFSSDPCIRIQKG